MQKGSTWLPAGRGWMVSMGVLALVGVVVGCESRPRTVDVEGLRGEERDLGRLLLTWQDDPTSTMTIQWMEHGVRRPLASGQRDEVPAWELPYVGEVDLDASREPGWVDEALHLAFLADEGHDVPAADDLEADAWLGWNASGLLVYLEVRDDVLWENPDTDRLWDGDGVELFVSTGVGEENRYQLIMSPGVSADQDRARADWHDRRTEADLPELAGNWDVAEAEGGYRKVVHLPWSNLGIEAEAGADVAFQLYVNDRDGDEASLRSVGWHPDRGASGNPSAKRALRLVEQTEQMVGGRLVSELEDDAGRAYVYAPSERVGEEVRLYATEELLGTSSFEAYGNVARAGFDVPRPPAVGRWGALHAYVGEDRLVSGESPVLGRYGDVERAEVAYYEYGRPGEARRVRTELSAVNQWPGMYRQRVELRGLEPDTAYQFQVAGYERPLAFYTMPRTMSRPIRFAAGGDTRHRKDWMVRTNRVAMAHEPEFIVWGGDLAYADAREERLYRWEEWFEANYETLIDEYGFVTPVIAGIGNHETRGGYYFNDDDYEPTDAWRESFAPYFYSLFAFPGHPGYGALDFGDYLSLISLDTAHTNPVAGEQAAWLEGALAEREGVRHVFPFYHVTAYPSHRSFEGRVETEVRETWTPLFDAYGIRGVFENHDHTYKRTPPIRGQEVAEDGVVYIGDGAWGVGTREVHDPEQTWYLEHAESTRHAIIVDLIGDRIEYRVYSEDGELIDSYTDDR